MPDIASMIKELGAKYASTTSDLGSRLRELEQRWDRAESAPRGVSTGKTIGGIVANSPEVQKMNSSFRGEAVVRIAGDDYAAITSAPATVGSNTSTTTSLVAADRRDEIIAPPEQRFVIRDSLPNTPTVSSSIEYPRETGFTNNAAPVAETTAKPYSDITFELETAPVRVLAHLFKASRQIMDDAPALAGTSTAGLATASAMSKIGRSYSALNRTKLAGHCPAGNRVRNQPHSCR